MARRPRSRSAASSHIGVFVAVGVVIAIAVAYAIAIFATVSSIESITKAPGTSSGTSVIVRGPVVGAIGVPLTKAGVYSVGDSEATIWVVTGKGTPNVGDRWVVHGTVRVAVDGQALVKAVSDVAGGFAPGSAVDAFAQKVTGLRIGAFIVEARRHQWVFAPWL